MTWPDEVGHFSTNETRRPNFELLVSRIGEAMRSASLVVMLAMSTGGLVGCVSQDDPVVAQERGHLLLAAGRLEDAVFAYRDALEREPNNADFQLDLALALHASGQHGEAIEQLNSLLEANPAASRARVTRGRWHLEQGRLDEAAVDFQRSIVAAPMEAGTYVWRAALFLRTGDLDRAKEDVQVAEGLAPGDPEVLAIRGKVAAADQQFDDGVRWLSEALRSDPRLVPALVWRAETWTSLGKAELAQADWDRAREIDGKMTDGLASKEIRVLKPAIATAPTEHRPAANAALEAEGFRDVEWVSFERAFARRANEKWLILVKRANRGVASLSADEVAAMKTHGERVALVLLDANDAKSVELTAPWTPNVLTPTAFEASIE